MKKSENFSVEEDAEEGALLTSGRISPKSRTEYVRNITLSSTLYPCSFLLSIIGSSEQNTSKQNPAGAVYRSNNTDVNKSPASPANILSAISFPSDAFSNTVAILVFHTYPKMDPASTQFPEFYPFFAGRDLGSRCDQRTSLRSPFLQTRSLLRSNGRRDRFARRPKVDRMVRKFRSELWKSKATPQINNILA